MIIDAVNENLLAVEHVGRAVESVLYVKSRLGLFENYYIFSKWQYIIVVLKHKNKFLIILVIFPGAS